MKIKVVYCKFGEKPKVLEIDRTLEEMQRLVGGHIETYPYGYAPMVFVVNEEGKNLGLTPHRLIAHGRDVICGDFFVAAIGMSEEGCLDIVGLTDEQIHSVLVTVDNGRLYR